jgi:hypothetical protein
MATTCTRCGDPTADQPDRCWWCEAPLCASCTWDGPGHCGHPEAVAVNQLTAEAATWDERDRALQQVLERRMN